MKKYIEIKTGVCGGLPVFKKTRIEVKVIRAYLKIGISHAEIKRMYPSLKNVNLYSIGT